MALPPCPAPITVNFSAVFIFYLLIIFANSLLLGERNSVFIHFDTGAVDDAGANQSTPKLVVAQLRRIHQPHRD